MKESFRNFIIKTLKPTIYFVENDPFLGDFVTRVAKYKITNESVSFTLPSGESHILPLTKVFLMEKNAQKEAAKSVLPINEEHFKLVKELEEKGHLLSNYEKTQILEDGELSEVYQRLS